MKLTLSKLLLISAISGVSMASQGQTPSPGPEMILIKTTQKSPDQVVDAIKSYAKAKKWIYMGANKVKKGQVIMVKVCVPQVGKLLWPIGLHVSAMLPCGNLGVYKVKGKTEVSMLHPQYMQVLYPHAEVEKAVGVATPLLTEMLAAVSQ
mgnify:CR=1 FL=1